MAYPAAIPLFPLPNVVLFPGVLLPLHIFEERYRDMVRAVTEQTPSLIGMVLLAGDWQSAYEGRPDIYPLGCAGQVVQTERLEDGRYNILLQGLREFSVEEEIGETSYRQGRVRWRVPAGDGLSPQERESVYSLARRFLDQRNPDLAEKILGDSKMSDELLINFLCYALDIPPLEKQALLQAAAICNRASRLCEVLELSLRGGERGGGSDTVH